MLTYHSKSTQISLIHLQCIGITHQTLIHFDTKVLDSYSLLFVCYKLALWLRPTLQVAAGYSQNHWVLSAHWRQQICNHIAVEFTR